MFTARGLRLVVYGRLINYYQRYILLRCCQHTDSQSEAERIASYTLLTVCSLAGELPHSRQLGWLIDSMVDVIAQDLTSDGYRIDERDGFCGSEMLLGGGGLRDLARCLNRLDGFLRQVLVLRHVEAMSTKMISNIYGKSNSEIMSAIDRAERQLAEALVGVSWDGSARVSDDVALWMGELGAALSLESGQQTAGLVLRCLAEWGKEDGGFDRRLSGCNTN